MILRLPTKEQVDAFHAHLDVCKRCESQPFNLCPVGAGLLTAPFQSPESGSDGEGR